MTEPIASDLPVRQTFSPDLPELRLLAQFAGIEPSQMAAAFSVPELLFEHITLAELNRLTEVCVRIGVLSGQLAAASSIATATLEETMQALHAGEV